MTRHTRIRKGFCSLNNEFFEIEEPLFGSKPELLCPLCESNIFDIGGTLYHTKKEQDDGDSS